MELSLTTEYIEVGTEMFSKISSNSEDIQSFENYDTVLVTNGFSDVPISFSFHLFYFNF